MPTRLEADGAVAARVWKEVARVDVALVVLVPRVRSAPLEPSPGGSRSAAALPSRLERTVDRSLGTGLAWFVAVARK